jgi:hypothetical protein
MKIKLLPIAIILMTITALIIILPACKKQPTPDDKTDKPDQPAFIQLADSTMFVTTLDTVNKSNLGTTVYVLNASTGALTTTYHYPYYPKTTWSYPAVGNGFLYTLENNKINAINKNTGVVLWTDTVNNFSVPVLHDDTFYGVYRISATSYGVYALDATKASKTYLWKYVATGGLSIPFPSGAGNPTVTPIIRYYNGTLYVSGDKQNLAALDPRTGVVKWVRSTTTTALYSFAAINDGVIMAGNNIIDAATGNQIKTVTPAAVPPSYGAETRPIATAEYATKDLYLVKTYHFNNTPGVSTSFLSAVDRASGVEKWHINTGSGYVNFDTVNTVTNVWNNRLVVKHSVNFGAGKYGTGSVDNFRTLDINNGSLKVSFDDAGEGIVYESFIVNNTMFFHNVGVNIGSFYVPTVNYLYAIDLGTGKKKWTNDKLLAGYNDAVFSCVLASGKGFSPFIQ